MIKQKQASKQTLVPPRESSKPRKLFIIGGVLISLSIVIFCLIIYLLPAPTPKPVPAIDLGPIGDTDQATSLIEPTSKTFTDNIADLLDATNAIRAKNNLPAFSMNPKLNVSAKAKCDDMVKRNYWDHRDPSGQDPYHFFTEAGVKYSKAGENLAFGYTNAQQTINGWMNSQSHKDNLLDGEFAQVGFAICESDDFINQGRQDIVVQHLIKPR